MKTHALLAGAVLLSLVLAFAAVRATGRVSHAAPEDDIESAFLALVEAWNNEDLEAFAGHFNDEGIADQFYGLTGDEALEAIEADRMALGPIVSSSIANIESTNDAATAEVEIEFEAGLSLYEKWEFSLEDGNWVAGAGTTLYRPLPDGVTPVSMTVQEYAFVFDKTAVASGNFGLNVTNAGAEEHEVLVIGLGPNGTAADVIGAVLETDELPEWAEFVTLEFFEPGVSGTVILPTPLSAGRYAFLCFLPAPDETPHAALGMVSEFTVGGDASVSAPRAGSAGLADVDNKGWNIGLLLALAAGIALATAALAGFAWSKSRVQ